MIFDSAASITAVTPQFASEIGCTPYGTLTGFRMRGDRLEGQKCGEVAISAGETVVTHELAVADFGSLLPAEAPPVDGLMGLDSFDGHLVTIALGDYQLHVDRRPGRGWNEGIVRLQREMGGVGLSAFVQVRAPQGTLWMLLDTGHLGEVFISPGAASQLNLEQSGQVELDLVGAGEQTANVSIVNGLIYDGVLGERFLRRFDVSIDLARGRIWWRRRRN